MSAFSASALDSSLTADVESLDVNANMPMPATKVVIAVIASPIGPPNADTAAFNACCAAVAMVSSPAINAVAVDFNFVAAVDAAVIIALTFPSLLDIA